MTRSPGRALPALAAVFDNADQPEELNDLILRGPGDVLITSRNHRWQSVVEAVPLDVLSRAESLEFLEKRAPRAFIRADAEALAEELGDLPLALGQAGAMLAEIGMPPQGYLRLLGEHVTGIMAEGRPYYVRCPWRRRGGVPFVGAAGGTAGPRADALLRLLRPGGDPA